MVNIICLLLVVYAIWVLVTLPIPSKNAEVMQLRIMTFYLSAPFPFRSKKRAQSCLQDYIRLKIDRIIKE